MSDPTGRVIVGAGRVGAALHRRSVAAGLPVTLVRRGEAIGGQGPILVCTRNDDLASVIAACPPARRSALVFVQNGMIRPLLRAHGLEGATRGLLFLAVPRLGDDVDPAGSSPLHGPRAAEVVSWFTAIGVPARVVDDHELRHIEAEKLLWNTVLGVVCQAHGWTVGEAARERHEVDRLVAELLPLVEAELGIRVPAGEMAERLHAWSRSIPEWRATVKEWPWRNGWFVEAARRDGVALPVHERLVSAAGLVPNPVRGAGIPPR